MAVKRNPHEPLFETVLRMKHNPSIAAVYGAHYGFLVDAKKFIIDVHEFYTWVTSTPIDDIDANSYLTSPYRSVWVEFFDLSNFSMRALGSTVGMEIYGMGQDLDRRKLYISCILEDAPNVLSFAVWDMDEIGREVFKGVYNSLNRLSSYLQISHIDAVMRKAIIGHKFSHGKRVAKTSPYAVLYLKQPNSKSTGPSEHGSTEWQYRWKVRGHWRRIKGIGKDPEGESIKGYTWVRECVKGPEDKPMLDRPTIALNRLPRSYKEASK